jgi:hypothetical protein
MSTPERPAEVLDPIEDEDTEDVETSFATSELIGVFTPRQILGGFALLAALILLLRRRRKRPDGKLG